MGQEEYNACIAAGGSPGTCAYLLEEDEAGNITNLSQLLNMQLFDLTRGGAPVRVRTINLPGRTGPGGYNLEDVGTGSRYFAANRMLVDTLGFAYQVSPGGDVNTGNPIQSRLMTQSERNAAVSAGIPLLGVPSGDGARAPAYTSTAAAQEDQQAHDREMTALNDQLREAQAARDYKRARELELYILNRQQQWQTGERVAGQEFQAGENVLARENQRRMALMGELSSIAQTAARIRGQYRSDLMGLEQTMKILLGETLGKDVVRGGIQSTGQVQRGVTPMQGFRTDVRGVGASAGQLAGQLEGPMPTPNLGADIPGLEAQMPQYQEWMTPPDLPQLPTAPAFMATGGTMFGPSGVIEGNVLAVDGVPVGTKGTSKVAVIVGEGRWDGDEEVVVQDRATGETEIIPLAGGAAEGANLPYDPSTIGQAMAPVYEHLGFKEPPKVSWGGVLPGGTTAGALERLGSKPRLLRDPVGGSIYFVDPSGTRRGIPDPESFFGWGFQEKDIVSMAPQEMAKMYPSMGAPLTQAPPLIEPGVSGRRFPPGPGLLSAPFSLDERSAGWAMPMMRTIADLWPGLSPYVQDVITSAYGVANINPAMMEAERKFFTPSGTARAPGTALIG